MTENKRWVQAPAARAPHRPVFWITEYQRIYPLTAKHHNKPAQPAGLR